MTKPLEDKMADIMDCMLGLNPTTGYIKIQDNDYYYCTILKTPDAKVDCCYKGKLIMELRQISNDEITNYYQCRRIELNAK